MNYGHTSETSETFDPDSKVVRSTQTVDQSTSEADAAANNAVSVANALPNGQQSGTASPSNKSSSTRNEETTNYEISKTVKTSTLDGGDIKKLSVAVAVDNNDITNVDGKVTTTKPRTAQEMMQIQALVKSAMGYDKTRGDEVQVVNMGFARMDAGGPVVPVASPLLGLDGSDWFKIIEVAILSVTALLIGFFVARPLIARMFAPGPAHLAYAPAGQGQLPAPAGSPEAQAQQQAQIAAGASPVSLPPPRESMIDIQRIEGQVRESSIRKVGEVVSAHPEEALSILRTWLHEPA
jgi:flagellar M-ring protein FliF